jgi:hypothetical protein
MEFLTVSVIRAQTFEATKIHEKGVPLSHCFCKNILELAECGTT